MAAPSTQTVDCDILIIGGGMSGCGAAFEAKYWGKDLRVVVVEKAVIERSGATGEGLSAINCYLGQRYGWNTPEDFVKYVVNDMMGLAREDLVYDVGRSGVYLSGRRRTGNTSASGAGKFLSMASPSSPSPPNPPAKRWGKATSMSVLPLPIY
jgi:hypothetical protein